MSQLPYTLTPTDVELTPTTKSLITRPGHIWGRLFPTLQCLSAYDLEGPTFKLGKNDDCDCLLNSNTFIDNKLGNISREHFVIIREPEKPVYIKDLSKNGTFINGEKIGKRKTRILQNDDEISIGFQGLIVFVYKNFENNNDNFLPAMLQKKYYASKFLGRGACGEVRLIFDKVTCRPYALKKIIKARSSKVCDMRNARAVLKEINILKDVGDHPFIVNIYDVVETADAFFIALEYMDGGNLKDLIVSRQLAENEAKLIFYQIVVAVEHLHNQGIIHRDLKADNILLKNVNTSNIIIKVSDFGLSKVLEDESMASTKCGTPHYVAPEVIDPTKPRYDRKIDIWSLGVLLYFMLSQELPFGSTSIRGLTQLIVEGKYNMSANVWEDISEEAKDLVRSMLIVSPDSRINMEDIPDHPWISNHPEISAKVNELLSSMSTTCTFNLEETIIGPSIKRVKLE